MQRGQRHLAGPDQVQRRRRRGGRSAARCRGGSRSRRAPPRAPARAGSPARSRVPPSTSSPQRTSASSSSTRSPFRYAKREPETRAAASMSIHSPARSRWSRGASRPPRLAHLAQRRVRVRRGRVGRVRQRARAPPRAPPRPPASSSVSALTRRETSCISAIAPAASSPAFLACAIALRGLVLARPQPLDLGQQLAPPLVERQRLASRASEPSPRRASARAHRVGVPPDRLQVEHCARAHGQRRALCACLTRVLRDELARPPRPPRRPRCSAASGRRRSRRCGSRRGPSRLVSLRWSKFGPSLYSRCWPSSAEPWVPATSSEWQPAQRSWKISAPSYSGLVLGDARSPRSRRRPRPRPRPEARGAAGGGA